MKSTSIGPFGQNGDHRQNCKALLSGSVSLAILICSITPIIGGKKREQCLELLQNHNLDQAAPVVVDLLKGALEE